jgi:beta-phosphoglucomutase-like phosphatase (HAD superfamily)
MRRLRPGLPPPTLEQWWLANFDPGIMEYLVHGLGLTAAELEREMEIWRSFTTTRSAPFFPGFLELLARFRRRGGRVAVVSHSEASTIERDYRRAGGPASQPDAIFGWSRDPDRRKPSPWPVREALARFGVEPAGAVVVDDLRPGVVMARAAGVAAIGAGWAHRVPAIRRWMRENCLAFCERVEDLEAFLL